MKFFKENWRILVVIIVIVVLFPTIMLITTYYKIIPYDSAIAIIGYGGSILGGFLTLYGVWWTIKEQNKNLIKQQKLLEVQRKENMAIQFRPILKVSVETIDSTLNNYDHTIRIILVFSNIGRGEACNINSTITSPYGFEKSIIKNIRFIPAGEKTKVFLDILLIDINKNYKGTKYRISTNFNDSYNIHQYELISKIYITYDGEEIKKSTCTNSNKTSI